MTERSERYRMLVKEQSVASGMSQKQVIARLDALQLEGHTPETAFVQFEKEWREAGGYERV